MKILYITTIGGTMVFFKSFIRKLIDEGHVVDIATNETDSKVPECYREWGCKVYPLSCTRSPFDFGNIKAIKEIKKLAESERYDIVHCHTPIAAACTRLACIKSRRNGTKVFYTAHGFHFYKGAPLKNWLVYYPVEWFCSFFTDVLITINKEDFGLAKKRMHAKRTEYVPGVGLDVEKFRSAVIDRSEKRKELGIPVNSILLTSVGELNANKNHEIIMHAMAKLDEKNIHYIIAGVGPLDEYLRNLAKKLGVSEKVHLLGYRNDVPELYKASDICCFPSIREGLGLAAVEGMAAGLPVIAAENRGTKEFVENGLNGFFCGYNDAESFKESIMYLCNNAKEREIMGKNAVESSGRFAQNLIFDDMERIYFG